MNDNRKAYLFDQAIKYLKELLDPQEQYAILYECIGLEDAEIKECGFDVENIKQYFEGEEE